jgi:TetR/AcrR family transcriptional regulator, transcriptional repressor for nem operon
VLEYPVVRAKQFDKHAALDEAMELFWERGYRATSIQDLVDRLGVNRQSLYDTYGGKDQLFLAALERYREIQAAPVRRLLERRGPALRVLRDFFQGAVDALLSEDCRGCLMANTVTELAGHDEAVTQVCSASARQFEGVLCGLLARAQQEGEIPAERSPLQLARFLMNTLSGLAVTAKATRERKVLNDVVEVALAALDR